MKNYQKKLIVVSLLILALCLCFSACNQAETDVNAENVTLVLQNGEEIKTINVNLKELGIEITEKTFMSEVLDTLKEKENLHYVKGTGDYGDFIIELGDLKPDSNSEWVKIYSSIEDEEVRELSPEYADETEINNTKVYMTGVGISSLPIRDDATYYFKVSKF